MSLAPFLAQGGIGVPVTLAVGAFTFFVAFVLFLAVLLAKIRSKGAFLASLGCLALAALPLATGLIFWRLALGRMERALDSGVDPEMAEVIREEGERDASWLPFFGILGAFPCGAVATGLLLVAARRREPVEVTPAF